jgi:hypothetical protein
MISDHPLEFGLTGFHPPLQGAAIAQSSEAMGFDLQSFPENHSQVPDAFGQMRDATRAITKIKLVGTGELQ